MGCFYTCFNMVEYTLMIPSFRTNSVDPDQTTPRPLEIQSSCIPDRNFCEPKPGLGTVDSYRHHVVIIAKHFDANILEELIWIEKCSYFGVKLTKQYIFRPKCNCWRKSMQEKESVMVVRCELKVPSLWITVRHHRTVNTSWQNFQSATHYH